MQLWRQRAEDARAEVDRLRLELAELQESAQAEIDALRERAEQSERGRDLASRTDAHEQTVRALVRSSAECDALRLEVARLTRERDADAAEVDRLSRELVTLRNRAETVGLAAAPAGDPETLDCPQFGASGDPSRQDGPAIDPANPPLRLDLQRRRMTRCQSDDDGYCDWVHCPQERDGEKAKGRHCPLDVEEGDPHDG
jgi:hypothetical protein